jgi:hypothetical protein
VADHSFRSPTSNRRNRRHFPRSSNRTLNYTVVISLERRLATLVTPH